MLAGVALGALMLGTLMLAACRGDGLPEFPPFRAGERFLEAQRLVERRVAWEEAQRAERLARADREKNALTQAEWAAMKRRLAASQRAGRR
ncbi:MAG: hypothetical protein HY423_08355 [Candidatus Lambdaproteobacteria bacterium]|nr:hypothetical protein [Candidatus Lambdaproteobacteria bacterium]